MTPLTVLLWVLPLAAIVAAGGSSPTRAGGALRREPLQRRTPGLRRARQVGRLRAGRHCAGGRRRQLRPDRQLSQVRVWRRAAARTPGLLARARALDPAGAAAVNEEEMARLALGLRTRLQNDAGNVEG